MKGALCGIMRGLAINTIACAHHRSPKIHLNAKCDDLVYGQLCKAFPELFRGGSRNAEIGVIVRELVTSLRALNLSTLCDHNYLVKYGNKFVKPSVVFNSRLKDILDTIDKRLSKLSLKKTNVAEHPFGTVERAVKLLEAPLTGDGMSRKIRPRPGRPKRSKTHYLI